LLANAGAHPVLKVPTNPGDREPVVFLFQLGSLGGNDLLGLGADIFDRSLSGCVFVNAIFDFLWLGLERICARRLHIVWFLQLGDPGLGRRQSPPQLPGLVLRIAHSPVSLSLALSVEDLKFSGQLQPRDPFGMAP